MNSAGQTIQYVSESEDETQCLGEMIARHLCGGVFIALSGTLGAGKTRLVQAIAEALGVARTDVTSPTFALVQHYRGRLPLTHIDAYRIADDDEYLELGIDEMCDEESVVIMEWAERFHKLLPPERLSIEISVSGDQQREFVVSWPSGSGPAADVGEAIRQDLKQAKRG